MDVSLVTLDEIKLVAIKVVGRRSELSHRVPLAWSTHKPRRLRL